MLLMSVKQARLNQFTSDVILIEGVFQVLTRCSLDRLVIRVLDLVILTLFDDYDRPCSDAIVFSSRRKSMHSFASSTNQASTIKGSITF